MPVAAASRSSVRVDGFTLPASRRAITAGIMCMRLVSCYLVRPARASAPIAATRVNFSYSGRSRGGEGLLRRDHRAFDMLDVGLVYSPEPERLHQPHDALHGLRMC